MERITHTAILTNGVVYKVALPSRHHNVIWRMRELGIDLEIIADGEEGFFTSENRFVDRTRGWGVAVAANQIVREFSGPRETLYSEHLWIGNNDDDYPAISFTNLV